VYTEIDVDFLINENEENNEDTKTSDNQENNREYKRKRNTKEMGISILKKTIALKLRNKKLKKMYEVIPHETSKRDRDMKKEVHKTRMKILKKKLELKENQFFAELKINVERLKAVKVKNEIRVLQKQIKEAKLEKLLKD